MVASGSFAFLQSADTPATARGKCHNRPMRFFNVECGVKQTLGYMAQCGAEEGHLVVMDRRSEERRRSEEQRRGEGAEARRDGEGEADGDGRRRNVRGVVVWML